MCIRDRNFTLDAARDGPTDDGWDAEIAAWFLEQAGAPRWFEEDQEAELGRVRAVEFEDDRRQWPVARW
eukprot:9928489-Alexandrium_andersonii.AAC.1